MKSKASKIAAGLIALILIVAVAIPMFSMNSSAAFDKSQYEVTDGITDYDAMDIQRILNSDESLTWVFAGDSITHNNQWTQGMNSYAEWFEQYLYDIQRNNDSVINTAWGGSDILDFQTEENTSGTNGTASDAGMGIENFITKYSPDVVFINVGMNDRDQTTENFKSRYETMLTSLYDISYNNNKKIPKVVVIAPTPVSSENAYDDLWDSEQDKGSEAAANEHYDSTLRLRNALDDIVASCQEGGYQVLFSDFRSGFLAKAVEVGDDYSQMFFTDPSDGIIHPNAVGQYLMFNVLSDTLGIRDEKMPIYQIAYEEFENMALYAGDYTAIETYASSGTQDDYSTALTENAVWVVAGAEQMSGYEGATINRSMLRLFDNALRNLVANRDLRIVSAAAPGNTPAYLDANFDAVIGEHITATKAAGNTSVFMLLPEIPEVYKAGYDATTIETQVAAYKGYVESLIGKSKADVEILWTPLASEDATINGYLAQYAQAVREIANANESIILFDAYSIMNTLMGKDSSLVRNWFDNNGYISPLAATDITYTFVVEVEESYEAESNIATSELTGHNLRYSSDVRVFKGNYIRDNYEAIANVEGETVTLDVSAIENAGYTLDTSSLVLLPEAGTGNCHESLIPLKDVTTDLAYANSKFTFTAPCSNLNIAIYSTQSEEGMLYRFKDVDLTVDTDNVLDTTPNPTSVVLDSLEVVGAPAFELADTVNVTLYQYQKYPQICATAQDGLKITVTYTDKDGKDVREVVASGKNSGLIPEYVTTVKVTVDGTVGGNTEEKIYTLNLIRPDYPDIIITEVMQDGYDGYDVNGYDNYELVEIYNASGKDLNLLDYSIGYKKDYPSDAITETNGEWPYYFTGNNQAFNGKATYTGVNQITKYSSWWLDNETVTEPTEIIFPKDSTMVIWVKEQSANLTFDTLRKALEENAFAKDQKTLTVDVDGTETAVVPTEEQLVVAEIPKSEYENKRTLSARYNTTADSAFDYFYPDNFKSAFQEDYARGWLFILGDDAKQATNGAITEVGNDIISASKFVRVESDRLSSVFKYDVERGMSLVKDEAKLAGQGYSNLTSFGAIEYWQKPADLDDNTKPTVVESSVMFSVNSDTAAIRLAFSDDNDIRYMELNVKDSEGNVTTVSKDIVLESSFQNGGLASDNQTYEYTYAIAGAEENSEITFWGYVEDGNGNQTEFGSEDEKVSVCTKETQAFTGAEVADYLSKGTYPTMDGKLFAGWYTIDSIPSEVEAAKAAALGSNKPDENATYYALFVPEHVLSVKAQISGTLLDKDVTNDESAAIRFATTVDTLQYKQVGFKVSYLNKKEDLSSRAVYKQLYAVGEDTVLTTYTPQGEFCQESNYFRAECITDIPATYYDTEFTVTPYWITWDGTTVEGVTAVKTIAQGMPNDKVYISADGIDKAGYGTYAHPYATLNYALANVGHCGTIYIKGNYTIPADFTWNVHNKCVTIAGDAVETTGTKELLDFSALSELRINDVVTFSYLSLTLPTTVYAEGNKLVVKDSVEFTNAPTLYGGSKKLEVASTNLQLYAGTYATIYGGGNGTNVEGDTNVTIGGAVNGAIDYTKHEGTNNLYGGSRYGTVHGDTYINVETVTARFHYIYGAGYGTGTVVEGSTNVTFAGTAMSIYGGSHTGINADTHVTMTGGYVEQIFGGSYHNSMTGNTDVRVLGGEVKRRVYGGSYNDQDDSWETDYRVIGHSAVTIDKAATLSLNMSVKDNGLYAISRHSQVFEDEKGVFIFNDYENNTTNIEQIGGDDWSEYVGVTEQAYHYLVKATAGGQVIPAGNKLQIIPDTDNGYVATVKVDGKIVHYTEGESLYALPTLTSKTEQKEIIVTFGTTKQSTDNYDAKIGNGYYPTVEDAFNVVTTDTTIELLKASIKVSDTINVADGESAILKNAEGVKATVSRADAIVETASMFSVAAGGKLTVDGITLDGRTADEITNATTELASLMGSTVSLINTSGSVVLNNVTAQYAVKNGGHGAVVYGEAVSTASLTVNNSEFNYNKAIVQDEQGGQGGAICMYVGASNLNVSNTIFANNEAGGNGGAISTHAEQTTITDCVFTANSSSANGGAFYSGSNGVVTMTTTESSNEDIVFSGNTAKQGGAICIGSGTNTITGYTFEQNTGATGGTIYIGGSGTIIGVENQFTSNTAISGDTYGNGGAVYCAGTYMDINSSYIGNTAKNGGAVIVMSGGEATLERTNTSAVLKGNIANTTGGGAVYVNGGGSATVKGYQLIGNEAPSGGAVYVASGGEAICENNQFTSNKATSTDTTAKVGGGAVYCVGTYTEKGSNYYKGNTALNGGGVYANTGADMTISGATFEENITSNGTGGAICIISGATVGCENATFLNNRTNGNGTYKNGGAIYNQGTFTDTNSKYSGNKARNGGAVFAAAGSATLSGTDVTKAVIEGNNAVDASGGAIYVNGGSIYITGYIFEGNTGKTSANNAVHVTSGSATLSNVTFQGNTIQNIHVVTSLTFDHLLGKVQLLQNKAATKFVVSGSQDAGVVEFKPSSYADGTQVLHSAEEGITAEEFATVCNGIAVTQKDDGSYWCIDKNGKLVENPVASIQVGQVTEYFGTLEDAVSYANTYGGTEDTTTVEIVLLSDTSIASTLSIEKNMAIINSPDTVITISRGTVDEVEFSGNMFEVVVGATLTLGRNVTASETDALIIDGATTTAIGARTMTVPANAGFVLEKNATLQNANSTVAGAAVHTASTNTLIYGIIKDNKTSTNAGALYADTGSIVTIERATISGNSSSGSTGGAIWIISGATVNCQNATISNNATTKSNNGGAVYCQGNFTDNNSTYSGNEAKNGGAIFVAGTKNTTASVTLTGTDTTKALFQNNKAVAANGGAIYVNTYASISVTGYVFEGNTGTTNADSVIHIAQPTSSANLINLTFQGDVAQKIYFANGTLNYSGISTDLITNSSKANCVVASITADDGSTTYYETLADAVSYANQNGGTGDVAPIEIVVLENTTIDATLSITTNVTIVNYYGKDVTISRGIVDEAEFDEDMFTVMLDAKLTLGRSAEEGVGNLIIDGVTTDAVAGRTVTVNAGARFTLEQNATLQNANSTLTGAAIEAASTNSESIALDNLTPERNMTVIKGTITGNHSTVNGGGVNVCANANVGIQGATFKANTTGTSGVGAAVAINAEAIVICENATFDSNVAGIGKNGGAVYCAGTFCDTNSTYNSNKAKNGGAIFVTGTNAVAKLTGTDSTKARLENNQATGYQGKSGSRGGAIYVASGTISVIGYSFEGNITDNTTYPDSAIHMAGGSATLRNVAFTGTTIQKVYIASGSLSYFNVTWDDGLKYFAGSKDPVELTE